LQTFRFSTITNYLQTFELEITKKTGHETLHKAGFGKERKAYCQELQKLWHYFC